MDKQTVTKVDQRTVPRSTLQLDNVKEDALPLTYTGAFDFVSKKVNTTGVQYAYYDDGSLKWDANKGISKIDYDLNGYPRRIQFSNGNVTEYSYSSTGEKLSTIYRTAVPNITVALGQTLNLNSSNTLSVDSVRYVGKYIFKNGLLNMYLVEGGYATMVNGQPVYHYYTKDHQGNNRAVVNHSGTIEQIKHYYPFGAIFSDAGTNDGLQKYKYNGKELDRMYGLNEYDYGARQYDPLLCQFTQMDPLAEKYYGVNPYAYCANNPVNAVDPDGCDWVQKKHDGIKEFYYDRNIKSQKDIDRIYGANSGINYIQNNSSYELGGETYTFINDVENNKYGYVTKGTEKQDNTNILYGDDYTIFGTSDNSVDARTLHKNYFGTSYTGPNNPKDYSVNDSYQYKPRNRSEYGSYIHDILYDKANAKGTDGALKNTTPEVIKADIFLTNYNIVNMMNPRTPLLDKGRSALTASAFFFVVGYKILHNIIKR